MINKKYTGLSRGIYVRNDVIFNQDISDKAILIELGGVDNTLEEINNTLEVFSKIFSEFINEEKK
jgi:stage II sporulation protein P